MDNLLRILNRYRLLWHSLFWLLLLSYEGLVWGSLDCEYTRRFTISLTELPVKMLATYITLYLLIDKYLVRRKYGTFLLLLVLSMLTIGALQRGISYFIIYPRFAPESLAVPLYLPAKILIAVFAIYSIVAIPASFHLLRHWYVHQQAAQSLRQTTQQLEKDKLEAELKFLKSQIHPHFLFNTLNNLYALTLNESPKAPEVVYKLSELMSYMLYESNQPEVPLTKEIHYIENYITLEKIRYGDRLDVALNVFSALDNILIAPLILLPFVENGFKHGVSQQLDRVWIRIDVLTKGNTLIIKVENSKSVDQLTARSNAYSGIGLRNVRKRLDIIYQDYYSLQLFDEGESYLVVLKIELVQPASKHHTKELATQKTDDLLL